MAANGEGEASGTAEEDGGGVVFVSPVTAVNGDDDAKGAVAMRWFLVKIGVCRRRNGCELNITLTLGSWKIIYSNLQQTRFEFFLFPKIY